MGITNSMFAKKKNPQQGVGNDPDVQTIQNQGSAPATSTTNPPQSSAIQRYTELETELTRSSQVAPTQNSGLQKFGRRLIWIGVLVGIPVGVIYVLNLPYPVIRQPVAKNAPLLLLPSNMAIEANFKQGQATVEEARQLIESPTSPADLDRGEIKLKEGKSALDSIPVSYVADWADYSRGYWGYGWEFSPAALQGARVKVGQLEAKVFQEKNAQIALTDVEKEVIMAKAQLQQNSSPIEKKSAVQNWQAAIDRLNQIPPQTMAGRKAQQLISTSTRDLRAMAGLSVGNEKVGSLLGAAEEFAKKAAETGRNPPHTSARWTEIASMWQEAIQRLEKITAEDIQSYPEAQRRLVEYRASLSEVRVRLKNEQEAVQSIDLANQKLTTLWASLPKDGKDLNKNKAIANFIAINNDLEKISNGTTVYLKAQEVKLQVQQQLKLLQSAK
ncbi:MAG: hypothetical protein DCF19_13525 [Pseudanabaena frigida]|uniref:Uncharacterized protein n=1 Tax=Pseudanabaena frigida TaxID=945775 RepID=A0A2W4W5H1_9CYAN|nr:MAG: hypothetical protein DCF19_13525 [Pseudanabaena frigida]